MDTVKATYMCGMLRPAEKLDLVEGETVEVTIRRTMTPEEEEAVRRIRSAQTIDEWVEAANAAPGYPEGYDIIEALNANRHRSGQGSSPSAGSAGEAA